VLAQDDLGRHVAAAPCEARCLVPIREDHQVGVLQFPGQAKVKQFDPPSDIKLEDEERVSKEKCARVDVTVIMRREPKGKNSHTQYTQLT
jgi:hypothetical protein